MANRVRGRETVFRVAGLPPGITEGDAASIIDQVCEKLGGAEFSCHSTVHSLGQDPYFSERHAEMVATVTLDKIPPQLATESNSLVEEEADFRGELMLMSLTFDITFLGFTPLNELHCSQDEIIDCIAVSGLASHAFGSWKSRNGHFMWLRDDAKWRQPNVRVMLYGYDTTLVKSESFQTIEHIGTELGGALSRIRRVSQQGQIDPKPRPIVFIAHSLGGLVVKEAICKMSLSKEDIQRITASCIYGLIFFGVPNTGIRIEHWLPIVKGQPNEVMVRDLRPGSEYLLNLQRSFETQFTYPKSKILSVFETMRTRTAKLDEGRWQITGPPEILVEEDSATKPMDSAPESISLYIMQMNQNHADLPKFMHRHDVNYRNLIMELQNFWENAISDVRSRFTSRTSVPKRSSSHQRRKIQAKKPKDHLDPESITTGSTTSPGCGTNIDKTMLNNPSRTPTESPHSSLGLERLQLVENSPTCRSPGAPSSSRELLQSHAPGSGDDLSQASSLQEAVLRGRADVVNEFLRKGADVHRKLSSGETLLHLAVVNGHIDIVNLLLAYGANAHATDSSDSTLMHWVPAGRSDIVELLVRLGLKIDIKDGNGNSGLVLALFQGQLERVRTYLLNGADVNLAEPYQAWAAMEGDIAIPPIWIAILEKQTEALKVLVEHGADLRPRLWSDRLSVLHFAARFHIHEAVECLILAKADLEARDTCGRTALHCVTERGNSPSAGISLRLLLDAGADIEAKDQDGFTALHWAANSDGSAAVQGLLDGGADIESRSTDLRTPLHQAARSGRVEAVQQLLDKGADIHARDINSETPLHLACHSRCDNNLGVIKYLLGPGQANILEQADWGRLAPHQAAIWGFKEAVEFFLNEGFDRSSPDGEGLQMIHHAASNNRVDVLKLLLGRGTSARSGTRTEGEHPLHLAAREGHEQAVSLLCKYGADVNFPAWKNGYHPIHYAAQCGHDKVISVLRRIGANINVLDDQGKTALWYAAHEGHTSTVSLLCDYGAPPSGNFGHCTALVEAACQGHSDVVSVLCERGANVQINIHTRISPLVEATKKDHIEIVRILLKYDADVEVRSKNMYWTPLQIAAFENLKEMLKLLLEKGADRQALTKDGKTAWALAQQMGHVEVCQILGNPPIQVKPDTGVGASDLANSKKVAAGGKPSNSANSKRNAAGGKVSDSAHGKKVAASRKKASKK